MAADARSRPTPQQGGSQNLNQNQGTSTQVDGQGLLDQALAYAKRGWVVVPACAEPCAVPWHEQPCPGKRPLVKIKDRVTVLDEEIRRWWRRWPDASVAILTGDRSGLVVVDVDGEDGEQALAKLIESHGPLPPTMEVKTNRGRHLYFRHPGVKILTRKGDQFYPWGRDQGNAHGLDVRGDGGLVIAPPSPNRILANDLDPAEMPGAWVEPMSTSTTPKLGVDLDQALDQIRTSGESCSCMERILDEHAQHEGGRHAAMIKAQYALVQLGREQHPGAGDALDRLETAFLAGKPDGAGEWSRALDGAVAAAMAQEPESTGCPYAMRNPLDEEPGLDELLEQYAAKAKQKDPAQSKRDNYEQAVNKELERLIVRDAAQRRHQAMQADQLPDPELTSLADLLAEPDDDPTYRIDRLWPTGGNIILAAQRKAGKTSLIGNLARCLVDGDPFLGQPGPVHVGGYDVEQVDGMVALLDLELDRRMLRRWLRDQAIGKLDQVMVEPLRGRAHLFDVLDDKRRGKWAELLAHYGVQVLILDPLGALLDAYGRDENSNSDVGPVLQALDALKAEAGVQELLLAHHMGHNGERSRGASKLRGWPDAEWFLVRERAANGEEPPPDAARFFLAEGRDVMVPEAQLSYDLATRRLTIAGGNRVQHTATKHSPVLLKIISENPGLTQSAIVEAAMAAGIPKHPAENALHKLVRDATVRTEPGPNRSKLHYPAQVQEQTEGNLDPFAGPVAGP